MSEQADGTAGQFATVWAQARKRYAEVAGQELDPAQVPHPSSIAELERELENQNDRFEAFRAKKRGLFTAAANICRPISQMSEVGAQASSNAFQPSQACFAAIVLLIGAAKGVSDSYDAITELMDTLKDFLVRLTVYTQERLDKHLREKLAEVLSCVLEVFARSTKVIKRGIAGRFMAMGKNVLMGNDEKIQGLVDRLAKLTEAESRLAGAEALTEGKRTGRKVDELADATSQLNVTIQSNSQQVGDMNKTLRGMQTALESMDRPSSRIDKLKAILQPSPFPQDTFNEIKRGRVEGTGSWIYDEPNFQSWVARKSPYLWVSGIPGSGKSYLAQNIILYLQNMAQHNANGVPVTVAYFFFKDNNPMTRTLEQASSDIAFQISSQDSAYAKFLEAACQSPKDIASIPSRWRKLFLDYFLQNEDRSTFIVLDGIDEAIDQDREDFFKLLSDLPNEENSRLSIAMIGRPHLEDEINDALGYQVPAVYVDRYKNSADIISYIKLNLSKSRILRVLKKDLQDEIVETLSANAEGMFLWCELMLRDISKRSRPSTIREALKKPPRGLQEMLQHVLESFSSSMFEEDLDDLNLMFTWVTCSNGVLTLRFIDALLAMASEEGDGVIFLESKLRKSYASFFVLNRQDGLTTADLIANNDGMTGLAAEDELDVDFELDSKLKSHPDLTTVKFCHASIGDFFRNPKQGKVKAGEDAQPIGVDIMQSKLDVLKTCLKIINTTRRPDENNDPITLLDYASLNWDVHLASVNSDLAELQASDKVDVAELLIGIFTEREPLLAWSSQWGRGSWTETIMENLKKMLTDKDVIEGLPKAKRELVESWYDDQNPQHILTAMAQLHAEKWLTVNTWVPYWCMNSVVTLRRMMKGNYEATGESDVQESEVLDAARWSDVEQNDVWHYRLAISLRLGGDIEGAFREFDTTLEMNPKFIMALLSKASCYGRLGEYKKAQEIGLEGLQALKKRVEEHPELKTNMSALYSKEVGVEATQSAYATAASLLSEWYEEAEDYAPALKYRLESNRAAPLYNAFAKIVYLTEKADKFEEHGKWLNGKYELFEYPKVGETRTSQEIIDFLKEEQVALAFGRNYSRLSGALVDYGDSNDFVIGQIEKAATRSGNTEWLVNAYKDAAKLAQDQFRSVSSLVMMTRAMMTYRTAGQDENAAAIAEEVIHFASVSSAMDLNYVAYQTSINLNHLCDIHFNLCFYGDVENQEKHLAKMQWIASFGQKRSVWRSVVTMYRSPLWLATAYRELGRMEEARELAKPCMRYALSLLADDDINNDGEGFFAMGRTLIAAGAYDDAELLVNTAVKYCIPTKEQQKAKEERQKQRAPKLTPTQQWLTQARASRSKSSEMVVVCDFESKKAPDESTEVKEADALGVNGKETSKQTNHEGGEIEGEKKESSPEEELNENSQATADDDQGGPFDEYLPWECVGYCYGSDVEFVCKICLDVFCGSCKSILESGKYLENHMCSPMHNKWLSVTRDSTAETQQQLNQMVVPGFAELKDKIVREWELE